MDKINNEIYRCEISILEKQIDIIKFKMLNDNSAEDYRKINYNIWMTDININLSKISILKSKIV